ncbi:hypothetical protein TRFO_12079 [Tritrichomonas foetus]|uniref:protein-tyrosine-phosphatase n=1 Tax=Tritrichomonas foetus TaxID=1144522 RepID=A0A1J4J4I1_9EUKA|nr:hypothetical protein TRFO_12079 [Tritrichomonas foetus]|eukprot:OHS93063.1 hypothetical protein TRFO_12079 [Tritrichomonas foetus]
MGQSFSLEHDICAAHKPTKAIMMLAYERGNLTPISFLDFVKGPVSYSSNPILLVEPFDGAPPTLTCDQPAEKHSHTDLLRTVHQNYRITPYQFKTFRLWMLVANTISQALIQEVIEFSRSYNFSNFHCNLAIEASSLFYDTKHATSFSAIMRPPSAGFRSSSPLKPTTQLSQNPLLLRRSQQQQTPSSIGTTVSVGSSTNGGNPNSLLSATPCLLQTTFMSVPQLQAIDLNHSNFNGGNNFNLNSTINPTNFNNSTNANQTNAYDEVDDGLYIGSEIAAQNRELLKNIGITHIVNLNGHHTIAAFPDGFQYFTVKMSDSCFEELDEEFWKAVEFTKRAINQGGKVLVHCRLGISRSAALCVAYLMERKKMSFDTAFLALKAKRPAVNINQGFVEQLKSKEQMSKTAPFRGKPPLLKLRL